MLSDVDKQRLLQIAVTNNKLIDAAEQDRRPNLPNPIKETNFNYLRIAALDLYNCEFDELSVE